MPKLNKGMNADPKGGYMMRHFVAYHNVEKMGRDFKPKKFPVFFNSRKPANFLLQTIDNSVWAFSGKKGQQTTKDYDLCALFYPNEIIDDKRNVGVKRIEGFKGHIFRPPIRVNGFVWFKDLMRQQANFSLGISEIKNESIIQELTSLYNMRQPHTHAEVDTGDPINVDWIGRSAFKMFNIFSERIKQLPSGKTLTKNDLLISNFRLYSRNGIEIYYAPMGYVRKKSKIAIIGVTPGWTQMELSYRHSRSLINKYKAPQTIMAKIKCKIAFAGSMRTNLVDMLNELRLPQYIGIDSADTLFQGDEEIAHTTSALRYPIFVDGQNYTGHKPKILSNGIMLDMIERLLGSELRAIPQALIIPLGGASTQSVRHLSKIGVIDEERCLFGFPHPSGANAHRIKQFQEKYSEMESKLRMWFKRSA